MFEIIKNIFAVAFTIQISLIVVLLTFSWVNELIVARIRSRKSYIEAKRQLLQNIVNGNKIDIQNGKVNNLQRDKAVLKQVNKVVKQLVEGHEKGFISTEEFYKILNDYTNKDLKSILSPGSNNKEGEEKEKK